MIFLKSYKMIIIHIYSQLEALQPGNDKERLFQIVDLQVAVLQRYSYPHILGLSSVRSRFSRALWHCEAGTHSSDQLQSLEEKPFMYTIFQYSRKTVKYVLWLSLFCLLPFGFSFLYWNTKQWLKLKIENRTIFILISLIDLQISTDWVSIRKADFIYMECTLVGFPEWFGKHDNDFEQCSFPLIVTLHFLLNRYSW